MFKTKISTELLQNLRTLIKGKSLGAFIVSMNDEHNNEYLSCGDKKIQFISGFSGSFGFAAITLNLAALWTDGRYIEQAKKELDENWLVYQYPLEPSINSWLNDNMSDGSKIGFYKYQMTSTFYNMLKSNLKSTVSLFKSDECLIESTWMGRPPRVNNPIRVLPVDFTGELWHSKIDRVREKLENLKADCLFIFALDEIAWLFNMRGNDIKYNPVFFAYCIVSRSEIHLLIDSKHLQDSDDVCLHLQSSALCAEPNYEVTVYEYHDAPKILKEIFDRHKTVWFDSDTNVGYKDMVPEHKQIIEPSPVKLMKAIKTSEEIKGMKKCAIEDSVCLCKFYYWLSIMILKDLKVRESEAAEKLLEFRKEAPDFVSLSFDTISCVGSNGGFIHYKPQPGFDSLITMQEIYLCDSGSQYKTGTTDVTRTIHMGSYPTPEELMAYTIVVKSYIQLATAVFPTGTFGSKLDCLARYHVWQYGTTYNHGTGHGVGAFLNVHEGPISFSTPRGGGKETGLVENMIITIEPGLYKPNSYGIRVESDFIITKFQAPFSSGEEIMNLGDREQHNVTYLKFEPLTYFPIQTKMIIRELMTGPELTYLNSYHAECREKLGELLLSRGLLDQHRWLMVETEPI